jgi:mRNA interferase HigB
MRIITRRRLNEYAKHHPNAAASLSAWHDVARKSAWGSLQEIRQSFPQADPATVASGKTVVLFNIAGNHHRLITAIHYDTGKIFILEILTHAEYSNNRWKKSL